MSEADEAEPNSGDFFDWAIAKLEWESTSHRPGEWFTIWLRGALREIEYGNQPIPKGSAIARWTPSRPITESVVRKVFADALRRRWPMPSDEWLASAAPALMSLAIGRAAMREGLAPPERTRAGQRAAAVANDLARILDQIGPEAWLRHRRAGTPFPTEVALLIDKEVHDPADDLPPYMRLRQAISDALPHLRKLARPREKLDPMTTGALGSLFIAGMATAGVPRQSLGASKDGPKVRFICATLPLVGERGATADAISKCLSRHRDKWPLSWR